MKDAATVLVLLLLLAGLGTWLVLYLRNRGSGGPSPAPGPTPAPGPGQKLPDGASFEEPWKFYSVASITNSKNSGDWFGVDNLGNLWDAGQKVADPRWQSMDEQLKTKFFFRKPLEGNSWDSIVQTAQTAGATVMTEGIQQPDKCLLVEFPAVLVLTKDCVLEGLVVRRGGTVLLAPSSPNLTLKLQFGICESGGLIQCGYAANDARLDRNKRVTILFEDAPQGFAHSGVPCSQYSYKVHTPGVPPFPSKTGDVQPQCESDLDIGMLGGCISNVIGAKTFGCLFNGNIHLAGSVPSSSSFALWKASCGDKASQRPYVAGTTEYPTCWTSCASDKIKKGDTSIETTDDVSSWPVGGQVVITCHSEAWQGAGAFMDWQKCRYGVGGDSLYACPEPVINFSVAGEPEAPQEQSQSTFGVEVATIESLENKKLTFTQPLAWNHCQQATSSFPAADKSSTVSVTTPVHVGLLSRNIRILGRDEGSPVDPGKMPFNPRVSTDFFKNANDEQSMNLMPMGRMNRTHASEPPSSGSKAASPSLPPSSAWAGPGGSVTCDFRTGAESPTNGGKIYNASETDPPEPLGLFLHSADKQLDCGGSGPVAKGSALLGPSSKGGLGSVLGASLKFQYGCGVVLDGVELYQMGIPANTGSLGQYSVHFHCAGWGPRFTSYCEPSAQRLLQFKNSANWRSYSRWCVLHGTNYAELVNNVFCVCMGNGVFTEDGVEHNNNIEHNLMVLNVQTGLTKLAQDNGLDQNPSGIVGNFGPDGYSSASIWLTNTNNRVHRNVLCCNPAYGVGIWAIAINPRKKAAPASHCVGDEDLGLPGLVGLSLVGWSGQNVFKEAYLPIESTNFAGATEAIGNVKDLGGHSGGGTLQSCPYCAENTIYSMCQFYSESADDAVPWTGQHLNLFVPGRHFIPVNGNTTGSFLLNNADGDYPQAAATTAAQELAGKYVPRIFSQNLCYSMQGVCFAGNAMGGFIWTQSGTSVLIGNCVLGGDYWSNPSSLKDSANGGNLGSYASVLVDHVTNASISGSRDALTLCQGVLVAGPSTMLGLSTCTGSRYRYPPLPVDSFKKVVCERVNDDEAAAWVAFADGIKQEDIQGLIDTWLSGKYSSYPGAAGPERMPLYGVREDMTCSSQVPGADSLYYVFWYNDSNPQQSKKFSVDALQTKPVEKQWTPTQAQRASQGLFCSFSSGGKASVDEAFKDLYLVLQSPYVQQRWANLCAYTAVLPSIGKNDAAHPSGRKAPRPPSPSHSRRRRARGLEMGH